MDISQYIFIFVLSVSGLYLICLPIKHRLGLIPSPESFLTFLFLLLIFFLSALLLFPIRKI